VFGWLPPILIAHRHIWLIYPCTQLYLHLAHAGLGPLVGATASPPLEADLYSKQMFALFSCLLLQALTICIFCVAGPKPELIPVLHPPTCIYSIALSYYVYKSYGTPIVVSLDWTGTSFHPLHLVMWSASTSVQCILWQQIYHRQCMTLKSFPLPAKSILFAQGMLWTGLLGQLEFCNVLVNWAFNAACFALLYALLFSCTRPLRLAEEHYHRLATVNVPARTKPDGAPDPDREQHDAALRRIALHFRCARLYVFASWHGFPIVWALGVSGVIDGEMREMLYAICDVLAKFLPVSTYLSMLDVRY